MSASPTPQDLMRTIRLVIYDWAAQYAVHSGHSVEPSYLASLGNDIAFELGILEALESDPAKGGDA